MTGNFSYRQILLIYASWWLFWFLMQAIILHRLNITWQLSLMDAAISNALLALAGYITINTYRFYAPRLGGFRYRFGYIFLLTVICMTVLRYALQQIYPMEYSQFLESSIIIRYMFTLLMIAFVSLFSGFQFYINQQKKSEKRKDDAELLLRDAELSKLRQQLQPHFLFNSLNSISALVGSQPEQARKMIQQLSDFLRGTLKKDDQQLVELSEELKHLHLYLDIEKVRFGHRLNVVLNNDEDSLQMKLPSLLLQPVVENAIKFGLYDTVDAVTIEIKSSAKNNLLVIQVENPFDTATEKAKKGSGFGLSSIQKRLYLLYGRNDLLQTEQKENRFITTLLIPQKG